MATYPMNRHPNKLSRFNSMLLIAALVMMMYEARAISTKDAQLVPSAVKKAFLGPQMLAVLITSATTGPGVAINKKTVMM